MEALPGLLLGMGEFAMLIYNLKGVIMRKIFLTFLTNFNHVKSFLFLVIIIQLIIPVNSFSSQWRLGSGQNTLLGTESVNNIDDRIFNDVVKPLDRVLQNYREGMKLKYNSGSTVDVTSGEIVLSNSIGTIRLMVNISSTTAVTFADIDTGAEAGSTTYYVYATVTNATDETAIFKISLSSSAPTGATYYKRLGSFYNDSGSDMTIVKNDNDNMIVTTGTVSNGGTISLPSGWAQDECDWTVAVGTLSDLGGSGAIDAITATVNSSRVATCTYNETNWVDGTTNTAGTCTANYIISCYR